MRFVIGFFFITCCGLFISYKANAFEFKYQNRQTVNVSGEIVLREFSQTRGTDSFNSIEEVSVRQEELSCRSEYDEEEHRHYVLISLVPKYLTSSSPLSLWSKMSISSPTPTPMSLRFVQDVVDSAAGEAFCAEFDSKTRAAVDGRGLLNVQLMDYKFRVLALGEKGYWGASVGPSNSPTPTCRVSLDEQITVRLPATGQELSGGNREALVDAYFGLFGKQDFETCFPKVHPYCSFVDRNRCVDCAPSEDRKTCVVTN